MAIPLGRQIASKSVLSSGSVAPWPRVCHKKDCYVAGLRLCVTEDTRIKIVVVPDLAEPVVAR